MKGLFLPTSLNVPFTTFKSFKSFPTTQYLLENMQQGQHPSWPILVMLRDEFKNHQLKIFFCFKKYFIIIGVYIFFFEKHIYIVYLFVNKTFLFCNVSCLLKSPFPPLLLLLTDTQSMVIVLWGETTCVAYAYIHKTMNLKCFPAS